MPILFRQTALCFLRALEKQRHIYPLWLSILRYEPNFGPRAFRSAPASSFSSLQPTMLLQVRTMGAVYGLIGETRLGALSSYHYNLQGSTSSGKQRDYRIPRSTHNESRCALTLRPRLTDSGPAIASLCTCST